MKTNNNRRRGGFSLMELLLVLVILGVLAALVVPRFVNRSEDARKTAAEVDINSIQGMLEAFEIDNGRFPSNDEGLDALMKAPPSATNWNGPYLRRDPIDPWGNEYIYRYPGQENPDLFDLYSRGPDGRDGGNDDVGNWGDEGGGN